MIHIPVLKEEVLENLNIEEGKNFIDGTFGLGGHSIEIAKLGGNVLGIERDPELYKRFQNTELDSYLKDKLIVVNDSYINMADIVKEKQIAPIDGILLDFGMSSWHLDNSGRGFTFQKDEPLDMRFDPDNNPDTAYEIVNGFPPDEIERILEEYGEEQFAKVITKNIVQQRKIKPITTTLDLVEVIWRSLPSWYKRQKIHPATKTFQALRIAVNSELENIRKVLSSAVDLLDKDGRLLTISFHSLEDRIAKQFFRELKEKEIVKVLTKKPIQATGEEVAQNPRSRSAKLRVVEKII